MDEKYSNFEVGVSDDEVLKRTKGRCAHCGLLYHIQTHSQHKLFPEKLGGKLEEHNLVMLCRNCLDRFEDKVYINMAIEFPYLIEDERIKTMHYIEDVLNTVGE